MFAAMDKKNVEPDPSIAFVEDCLATSQWHMNVLRVVADMSLPDWAIGAGFVRNLVWDRLHGRGCQALPADVDVLYYSESHVGCRAEEEITNRLAATMPGTPWSVKNQARMHIRNGDQPYRCTLDAIGFWLETPTAVAVNLETDDKIEVLAPYGVADLIDLRVRPTPAGRRKPHAYSARVKDKKWQERWPKLRVEWPDPIQRI